MRSGVIITFLTFGLAHCGASAVEPAVPIAPPAALVDAGAPSVAAAKPSATPDALGPLALKVPAGQSYAFKLKTKTETPGRKTETETTLFIDAWSDGSLLASTQTGEHEGTAMPEYLTQNMPLPPGAQTTTITTKHEGKTKFGESEVTERFDRNPLGGGREQITFHIEKKRKYDDETTDGDGVFDVTNGRYEKLRVTRSRRTKPKAVPGLTKPMTPRETKTELALDFDAEGSAARAKEWASRREQIAKAADQPAGTANVIAELAAALSGSTPNETLLEFHAHGRPILVWKAVLAHGGTTDRIRGLNFPKNEVPPEVAREVHLTLQKSPSHGVSWLVLSSRDPKFLADIEMISKRHKDEEARDYAKMVAKDLRKAATPLSVRLKQATSIAAAREIFWGMDFDAERERDVLFEWVLPKLAGAADEERAMYTQMLTTIAKVSIGDDPAAWSKYWESHKSKPYEEWLIEALASDSEAYMRNEAAEALARRAPTEATKQALRAALEDASAETRIQAATALAAFHDEAAIRPLIRALPNENLRWNAWNGLSHFSESDFGLGPSTKDAEVYAALGRWVGWAKRRGVDPGFP